MDTSIRSVFYTDRFQSAVGARSLLELNSCLASPPCLYFLHHNPSHPRPRRPRSLSPAPRQKIGPWPLQTRRHYARPCQGHYSRRGTVLRPLVDHCQPTHLCSRFHDEEVGKGRLLYGCNTGWSFHRKTRPRHVDKVLGRLYRLPCISACVRNVRRGKAQVGVKLPRRKNCPPSKSHIAPSYCVSRCLT